MYLYCISVSVGGMDRTRLLCFGGCFLFGRILSEGHKEYLIQVALNVLQTDEVEK